MKSIFTKITALLPIFIFFGCSTISQPKIKLEDGVDFHVKNLNSQKEQSFGEFINELARYDIVLLGERHDNKKHRASEAKIVNALQEIRQVDVVLEMFDVSEQAKLDIAKADRANTRAFKKLIKPNKKWNYGGFEYMIKSLVESDANMIAGNLTRDEIKRIHSGAEPIKGRFSTTKSVQDSIKNIIGSMHKVDDDDVLDKFVQIQQYKDRRMADKLIHSKNLAVLIAGRFHTVKDIGVPLHIKDFNQFKKPKKVAVVALEFDEDSIDKSQADYLFSFK